MGTPLNWFLFNLFVVISIALDLRVFHRDPIFGTFQFSGQYSWLVRHPWYVAPGQPRSANLNMLYIGLRYVLPAAPAVE